MKAVPSPGYIAAQLNKRATLTPRGGTWQTRACGIRSLLEVAVTILTLTDAARGD